MLHTFSMSQWDESLTDESKVEAVQQLESGQVLFFPQLSFALLPDELKFCSSEIADPHSKNISYHAAYNKLWGVRNLEDVQHLQLKKMLDRFSRYAFGLIKTVLPRYVNHLTVARTSFRPVQVSHRKTSYRKDDKRLHVDAFPSTPNQGKRILRVFCNINPAGEDRVWRVGDKFENVAQHFIPQIRKPILGTSTLLRILNITKSYRTAYDHYMLHMHDRMKGDQQYQQTCPQEEIRFPTGSSWIVQTDQVSHAAMQGQHVLEQTFYLPVQAMQDEAKSPLRVLEKILGERLI